MKRLFFILIVWLMVAGCTPQARINRIVNRHPELLRRDTITRIIPVPVPEIATKKRFFYLPGDTVRIDTGRLEILYYRDHDTVVISGRCKADTIFVSDTIYLPRIIVQPPAPQKESTFRMFLRRAPWIFSALIIAALLFFFAKLFKR